MVDVISKVECGFTEVAEISTKNQFTTEVIVGMNIVSFVFQKDQFRVRKMNS